MAHNCQVSAVSSQATVTVNNSTNSTQASTPTSAINTSATNLLDALESIKQQSFASKLTSSLLNTAAAAAASNSLINHVSNSSLITPNNLATLSQSKSNNNNQAFKCTICGYKGHTLRGMKTHVRVHGDQLQGAQEEAFIKPLNDHDCCVGLPIVNGSNTRSSQQTTNLSQSNKRRRSTDPMSSLLSSFVLPPSSSNSILSKELLLANNLNPLLLNGLMGNLVNNLTNNLGNHLVNSGLASSSLANANNLPASLASVNELLLNSAVSENEDNLDNLDSHQLSNSATNLTTCNGTMSGLSNNSSIGKC